MTTQMLQRRGTAAQWAGANPVLSAGEIGFETDTGLLKIGNGVDDWGSLLYVVPGSGTRLNYAEKTTVQSGIGSIVDVAGLTFTITGTGRPIKLNGVITTITPSTTDMLTGIYITKDNNDALNQWTINHNINGVNGRNGGMVPCWVGPGESGNRFLAAGVEQSYKVRILAVGGTVSIEASGVSPSYFEAIAG